MSGHSLFKATPPLKVNHVIIRVLVVHWNRCWNIFCNDRLSKWVDIVFSVSILGGEILCNWILLLHAAWSWHAQEYCKKTSLGKLKQNKVKPLNIWRRLSLNYPTIPLSIFEKIQVLARQGTFKLTRKKTRAFCKYHLCMLAFSANCRQSTPV